MIQIIKKYFPGLEPKQIEAFEKMMQLYPQWNERINVISRKDIDNLEVNHLLHSLAIAKFIDFKPGSAVLDLGCGGGLPGLPLAVLFPNVHFHLIDRIGKKIRVATEIASACNLQNVTLQHGDSGEAKRGAFDFVVSRAVMPLPDLMKASAPLISKENKNSMPNGLITLKGGELDKELGRYKNSTLIEPLSAYFPDEPFFETKVLTYTPI